jgi:RNA polymerase sigma-70 factor (ECF subfamily)
MAEPQSHDQELLREIAKGDEAAFRALYERYQGRLYRFAMHMSGNTATAEEVTQEVFMLLMSKPKAYQAHKGTVAGYLFGIARNLTRRSLRERSRDVAVALSPDECDCAELAMDGDLLQDLTQSELLDSLRKAVPTLPEPYREVVVLCDLEEMSYADAADLLECSEGTVASRLHRARAMLKVKLSRQACVR